MPSNINQPLCFLFQCNCSGDSLCESIKSNISPCEDEVLQATKEDTVVPCVTAQWICDADSQCSNALFYYNLHCPLMFRGERCTDRCLNAIRILQRQDKASKLETCACTGKEPFDCKAIKANMDNLCFAPPQENNEIEDDDSKSSSLKLRVQKFLLLVSLFVSALANLILESLRSALGIGTSDASLPHNVDMKNNDVKRNLPSSAVY